MCNLHIKETEISQKRSKGIKNWKITYSVILSVLPNKTNLILGFSSPLTTNSCRSVRWDSSQRSAVSSRSSRRLLDVGREESLKRGKCWFVFFFPPPLNKQYHLFYSSFFFFRFYFFLFFFFCPHIKILSSIFHWPSQCDRRLESDVGAHCWVAGICRSWGRYSIWGLAVEAPGWPRHPSSISDAVVK